MRNAILILVIIFFQTDLIFSQIADFKSDTVCYRNSTTLISTSVSEDKIIRFDWDLNGDGKFDNASGDTIKYVFPKPGENTAGLRIITETGLSKAIYKQVKVHYLPEPDFYWEHPCESEETLFFNESTIKEGSISVYKWNFGDVSEDVYEENPIHVFDYVSTFDVKFALTSNIGCKDSIFQDVLIRSVPVINIEFSGDTTFYKGDSLMMRVYGSYDSVIWSNGMKRSRIYVKTSGIYTATAYSKGCFKSRSIHVLVKERAPLKAMNLITPNGDGYNDKWEIFEIDQYHPCQVTIFNRYGVPVFASFYYKNDWDAKLNGNPLPEGTYYYLVITGTMEEFTGAINVIR
ncbi:MAG: gliding motility-associated C-terminal domain-containing protein [Bacteroidales bacterium]|nr:gliding motility-associated C-terminal domain-containing protein [Bacteroidales bacterium]